MRSGYKLFWSEKALTDLQHILSYLVENWTKKETQLFVSRLDKRLNIITLNPRLFPKTSKRKNVRKSVLTKQIAIYYQLNDSVINIVTLFDTRQNPKKLKSLISSRKAITKKRLR